MAIRLNPLLRSMCITGLFSGKALEFCDGGAKMMREQWRTLSEIWLDSTPKSLGSQTISVASGPNRKREDVKAPPAFALRAGHRTMRTDCRPFPREWSSVSGGWRHGPDRGVSWALVPSGFPLVLTGCGCSAIMPGKVTRGIRQKSARGVIIQEDFLKCNPVDCLGGFRLRYRNSGGRRIPYEK